MLTAQEVIDAADAADLDAYATDVPAHARNDLPVVNFWRDGARYPVATLTWPDPRRPKFNTFAWGHHYEHQAPPDTDAATLVQLVVASGVLDPDKVT